MYFLIPSFAIGHCLLPLAVHDTSSNLIRNLCVSWRNTTSDCDDSLSSSNVAEMVDEALA
jgi:hypothetical protein